MKTIIKAYLFSITSHHGEYDELLKEYLLIYAENATDAHDIVRRKCPYAASNSIKNHTIEYSQQHATKNPKRSRDMPGNPMQYE